MEQLLLRRKPPGYIAWLELVGQMSFAIATHLPELPRDSAETKVEETLAQMKIVNFSPGVQVVVGGLELEGQMPALGLLPPEHLYSWMAQTHILHLNQPISNLDPKYRKPPGGRLL